MYDPDSTTFTQRIILCCLVDLTGRDRTPADAAEIRSTARELLENADGQPIGGLSEADTVRALSGLTEKGLLDERRPEDRSPVGKGRPKYALEADIERLREGLRDDDDIGSILR
ncbi:MAG: hypothetical protein ACQET5_03970 [Halobacteriota archaeon]|uniref:hypothetical protein n=1 Tax=Natronomonas sp. TaxID=2184060 RepID=UPI003975DFB6